MTIARKPMQEFSDYLIQGDDPRFFDTVKYQMDDYTKRVNALLDELEAVMAKGGEE